MRDVLYLVFCYLRHNRFKTLVLVLSVMLIVFLPLGLKVLVGQSADSLSARAESTPLIVGAKGSPLELVLNALYFESDPPAVMTFSESQRVMDSGNAIAIPLYTRFRARDFPIVGTTLDYFDFRVLSVESGRKFAVIGECVVGSEVARLQGLELDSHVLSSPESVFDLVGVYPLKMKVVGILAATGTPDDRAILVDLKTSWIIEGLAHGHQDMLSPEARSAVLKRDGNVVVANASVVQYNEITAANMDSFHFHGDQADFPISAVIAVPHSQKSATLLQGKYLAKDERVQIVQPSRVMDELLETILTVQSYVVASIVVIGCSTLMTTILVFMLSLRLREREIEAMHRIGASKSKVVAMLSAEVVVVLLIGVSLALGLTLIVSRFGAELIRVFI